jgi:hypothetical protein
LRRAGANNSEPNQAILRESNRQAGASEKQPDRRLQVIAIDEKSNTVHR